MAERAAAENAGSGPLETLRAIAEGNLGDDPWQANYEKIRAVAKAGIAKAIRGTGQPPAPSPARDE